VVANRDIQVVDGDVAVLSSKFGLRMTGAHALAVRELSALHKDPFDRILLAQAQCESLPLLTAVAAGAKQALGYAARIRKRTVPLVAVPFMGEVGRKACEEAGVDWLDLSSRDTRIRRTRRNYHLQPLWPKYRAAFRADELILAARMRRESHPSIGPTDFVTGDEPPIHELVFHQPARRARDEFTIADEDAEFAGFPLQLCELASHGYQRVERGLCRGFGASPGTPEHPHLFVHGGRVVRGRLLHASASRYGRMNA